MVAIRLFVEGGGDAKSLRSACRRGFREFLLKAGFSGSMPRVIASGSRRSAYEDFCTAMSQAKKGYVCLLVDSEEAVAAGDGPWKHLKNRPDDQWPRPTAASDDQCHLMVQCMESWFLADRVTLAAFFGQGFNEKALPGREDIEAIPKADVLSSLKNASRGTATKGRYGKGRHSFAILALIDPLLVRRASPHADRLLTALAAPEQFLSGR